MGTVSVKLKPMSWKLFVIVFIFSRLFFFAGAHLASKYIPPDNGYMGSQVAINEPHLIWELANMDGRHFIWIARDGYAGSNFAYFPLFPLLIGLLHRLTQLSFIYSALLISILSTLGSIYLLKKISMFEKHVNHAEVLLLFLFLPFSFVLHTTYADALFLFLTLASLYLARKKNWPAAGVFAGFAALTRLSGLALFPALIFEWRQQNKNFTLKALIAPVLNFLGFFVYTVFLQINFGNWRLFQTSMSAWKQEKFVTLIQVVFRYLKIFDTVSPHLLVFWVAVMEFISFFLYIAIGIYVYKNIRKSYGVFMIVLLMLVTFTGTFAGTPRYLVHLFPAYIGIAHWLNKHPRWRFVYYPISIILGIVLVALFTQGHFVG